MFLKITDKAQARLLSYLDEKAVLVLDMDDGVGEYSKTGSCSLDTSFRFLILDPEQSRKDYNEELANDLGIIYIKEYSKRYLDEEMTLDFDERLYVLTLKSPSGTLDGNVEIVDLRKIA